jgi:selenocysteine lyase/cysteine desulfurase
MDLAERTGAAFVSVPRPGDDDWTSALLSFIDRSTGIVAVPHCHWTDGGLIDLEAIGAACRRVGAVLCVDATQSVGALPLDVKRVDPDFLAVASYKWLLGPVQSWVSVRCAALARRASHRAQLDCTQGLRKFRRSRELQR